MAFPTSPTNGQTYTVNGIIYVYNSTKTAWQIQSSGSATVPTTVGANLSVANNLTVTGNANVGNIGTTTAIATTANLTTINSPLIQNGNSNVSIAANGNVSIASNGLVRATFETNGRMLLPFQPSFHAYGLGSTPTATNVIYPSTDFNVGSHYNATNGRFTAPVAGTYIFGWTAIGNTTNDVYRWFFRVNGSTVRDIQFRQDTAATGSEYGTNGMYVIPWKLNLNDYVNIYYTADAGTAPYANNNASDNYPRFWGYLLG